MVNSTFINNQLATNLRKKHKNTHLFVPKKRRSLIKWMSMSQEEVLDCFNSLEGAIERGSRTNNSACVIVPGSRSDRVLLIAHADTVCKKQVNVHYDSSGVYFSLDPEVGIGADDRAGCAMLWELKKYGHSLLITSGEEVGCIGSKAFVKSNAKWIADHSFAIELDRKGKQDCVFYNVGSDAFVKFIKKEIPLYNKNTGFSTDIKYLCESIAGVNLSIGYYNEHTPNEILKHGEWKKALHFVKKLLEKPSISKFKRDKNFGKPPTVYGGYNNSTNYSHSNSTFDVKFDPTLVRCPSCNGTMSLDQAKINLFFCLFCQEGIHNV